ncbi:MAG: DNA-binding protein [Candidatus Nanohalarchaeota archaeon]|nr:MAG: DNA-binding protein [Candidatus Nanohaloarchaeota archaeon]
MREETRRLWIQAKEDIKTAKILLENKRYYACVFFAHQAAEKALKALHIHLKREPPPRTHNLLDLLNSLEISEEDLIDAAMDLTPEYIVARYPDAANGVPALLYNEKIAKEHLKKAEKILSFCEEKLAEK